MSLGGSAAVPLLALLAAAANAQKAVHGTVLDATTRQPIARVLVECNDAAGTLTDKNGQFVLALSVQNSSQDYVNLQWRRPGYVDPDGGNAGNRLIHLVPDQPQVLTLERTASIHGRVKLSDGETPDGFDLTLLQGVVNNGRRRWQVQQNAITRSDGSFSFPDLHAGAYRIASLVSTDPAPLDAPQLAASGYPITYAPGVRDPEAATTFRLAPGEQAEADMRLERVPFYPVSIVYTGQEPALPTINGEGGKNWAAYYNGRKHLILAPLPSGSYTVSIEAQGDHPVYASLPLTVKSGSGVRSTLTPMPAGRIMLETTVEGTGAQVISGAQPSVTAIQFDEAAPGEQQWGGPIVTDANTGAQQIQIGLHPGRYWVRASASAGYVARLEAGGVDLLREPLTISEGEGATIRAAIRTEPVSVDLLRKGALADQRCTAHLIPLLPGMNEITVELGVEGNSSGVPVQLFNTPPGGYLLVATPPNTSIAYREPGVLEKLRGAHVVIENGKTAELSVSEIDRAAGSF